METQKIGVFAFLLSYVPKILRLTDALTAGKIVILAFGILFLISCFSIWENRELLVNHVLNRNEKIQNWELSDKTKTSIKEEVDRHSGVTWMVVTEMDLGSNFKKFKFWYNEDQEAMRKYSFRLKQSPNTQIFDFDKIHTDQTVKVLQNEFICNKFDETTFKNHSPELKQQADYICRIAIPPFYGRFVGILSIGVKGEISDDVKFSVRAMTANIAATIYWRDVIKLPR